MRFSFHFRLLLVLTFFALQLHAQQERDSLISVYNNTKNHDTTRLEAVARLIDNLYEKDSAAIYNDLMGKLARQNLKPGISKTLQKKYSMYLAAYYNNIGIHLDKQGNARAIDYLDKSQQLYKSVGAWDEYNMGLVSKGFVLAKRKQYKEAVDCYFKALKYFERKPDENADGISYVYSNLGILYEEQHDYSQSIAYQQRAIAFIDRKKETITVEDESQKFILYHNIGAAYIKLKNYPQAIANLNRAVQLAHKNQQPSYLSFALGKLGQIDLLHNRIEQAEQKLLKADAIAQSDLSKSFTQVKLGEVYFQKREYAKAKKLLEQGLTRSQAIGNIDLQQQAYRLLYEVGKTTGDYKNSVAMLERYYQLKDSANVEENKNELAQQQMRYDYEKKALNYQLKTQKEAATKNNWLILLSAALVVLLLGSYLLYRNYKQKQARAIFEKHQLNQKLLLTQMNPHFIFNSLDNIQGLIFDGKKQEAVNYLNQFSKLTRQILENSSENYITLEEERQMIENYIGIQQLLYQNKFDYSIVIDPAINPESILLPPMLTQPFIENAIKHGLRDKSERGRVEIRFYFEGAQLFVSIADNGRGFGNSSSDNHKSLAMKITNERLRHISKVKYFELHQQNTTDAQNVVNGAKVFFQIPYLYEN